MDKFSNYKYFQGEQECPFNHPRNCTWWNFEKQHYESHNTTPFPEYLNAWIKEKAAPNSGWDLNKQGNPWLDEYNNKAPEE